MSRQPRAGPTARMHSPMDRAPSSWRALTMPRKSNPAAAPHNPTHRESLIREFANSNLTPEQSRQRAATLLNSKELLRNIRPDEKRGSQSFPNLPYPRSKGSRERAWRDSDNRHSHFSTTLIDTMEGGGCLEETVP